MPEEYEISRPLNEDPSNSSYAILAMKSGKKSPRTTVTRRGEKQCEFLLRYLADGFVSHVAWGRAGSSYRAGSFLGYQGSCCIGSRKQMIRSIQRSENGMGSLPRHIRWKIRKAIAEIRRGELLDILQVSTERSHGTYSFR